MAERKKKAHTITCKNSEEETRRCYFELEKINITATAFRVDQANYIINTIGTETPDRIVDKATDPDGQMDNFIIYMVTSKCRPGYYFSFSERKVKGHHVIIGQTRRKP